VTLKHPELEFVLPPHHTRDPVLDKLLRDLPLEDPDREYATVWCPWTEGEHRVPVGIPSKVDFGEWHGPRMKSIEVQYFARIGVKTYPCEVVWSTHPVIKAGDILTLTVTVPNV